MASGSPTQPRSSPALAPGHNTKAQPSGGMSVGEVISQLTLAVSPGRGLERSGAPSTSTRAPITRVRSTRDTGSISGAQAPASTDSATAAALQPLARRNRLSSISVVVVVFIFSLRRRPLLAWALFL